MKNSKEEKFFLYLKDELNFQERILFEDELKKSEILNNEFEEYKSLINSIIETKNVEINKDYLESIVPNFHSQLESKYKKKSLKNFRYVFTSLLIIVAGYLAISKYSVENKQEIDQALADLSTDEIDLIANDYYVEEDLTASMDDVSAQKVFSIYAEELKASLFGSTGDINTNAVLSKINITDVDQYFSDAEIELIYSQLIEKKIL